MERLAPLRDQINISKVCSRAILEETLVMEEFIRFRDEKKKKLKSWPDMFGALEDMGLVER